MCTPPSPSRWLPTCAAFTSSQFSISGRMWACVQISLSAVSIKRLWFSTPMWDFESRLLYIVMEESSLQPWHLFTFFFLAFQAVVIYLRHLLLTTIAAVAFGATTEVTSRYLLIYVTTTSSPTTEVGSSRPAACLGTLHYALCRSTYILYILVCSVFNYVRFWSIGQHYQVPQKWQFSNISKMVKICHWKWFQCLKPSRGSPMMV